MSELGSYQNGSYALGSYMDPTDMNAKYLKGFKDQFYATQYPPCSAMWQQGYIDTRFKVGDQSLNNIIYGDNQYYASRRFFFNLIKRHISMICGFQRKNRKSTIAIPLHDEDDLADAYNACLKWTENRDGFQEYLSQSFENACTTGLNILSLEMDYTLDPVSGDLVTDQVAYCNVLIDTYFRKQDLSDCTAMWRRRWVTRQGAKALLPGHAKEIDGMRFMGAKDGRFPLQAELMNLDTNKLLAYDQFYYRSTREAKLILDPYTGDNTEWEEDEGEDNEAELAHIMKQQPWLKIHKKQVPTVKLCVSIGDRILYDGPNLLNIDRYPMVPTLCYHEPDMQSYAWKITGVVRNLRDSQYLYNMRKVIELDILQSQINSGWIYPIDAVVDPKAFRQSGQGFLVPLKAGHLPGEIQRIEPPNIPASMLELSRSLSEDITKISGVNEELLGSATDDKAGILSMLRQGAGLTTLQTIFDKLDYTQRLYGEIRLQAIRKNFSKAKVERITGKKVNPLFFSSQSLKYSLAVEEGAYSTTQKQMELQQLLHFKEIGMTVADKSIFRASFITNKKEVEADATEQAQQQMQQQQAQMQQQSKIDNSKMMMEYAKSKAELARVQDLNASAAEKFARIDEIEANAHYKEKESELALVKEMIALEDMELSQVRNTLELSNIIKLSSEQQAQPALTR